MKKENQLYLFSEAPVSKALITIIVPTTISSLINIVYGMINSVFIAMLDNASMIAAISVSSSVVMTYGAFAAGIGIGAASYISRLLGAQRFDETKKTVTTAMTLCVIIYLLELLFAFTFMTPVLEYLSTDAEVFQYARTYSFVLMIGSISAITKQVMISLLQADGDVVFPTYLFLLSAVLNILLDPILMFDWGFGLGIVGVALATVISQFVVMFIMLHRMAVKSTYVKWKFSFGIDKTSLLEIVKVGSAVFIRDFLPSLSGASFTKSSGAFGTLFVAGAGVGKKASRFILTVVQGATKGFLPFAAYNYGAKNMKRLKEAILVLNKFLFIFIFIMIGAFLLFPTPIISLYTKDAVAIKYGVEMLMYSTLSLAITGIYNTSIVMLQALGHSKESMIVSLLRGVFYYIPIVIVLPKIIGMAGIYLTQPITDWLTLVTVLWISRQTIKEIFGKKKEDIQNT